MSDEKTTERANNYIFTHQAVLVDGKELSAGWGVKYSETLNVPGAKVQIQGAVIPDGSDVTVEYQYRNGPVRRDILRNVRSVGRSDYECDSIEWGVVGNDVRDVSLLEQQLGLPAGAIAAQQKGEKHAGQSIAIRFESDTGSVLKESIDCDGRDNPNRAKYSVADAVFELPSPSLHQSLEDQRRQSEALALAKHLTSGKTLAEYTKKSDTTTP